MWVLIVLYPDVWGLMKKYPDCVYFVSTLYHTVMRLFFWACLDMFMHAHNQQDFTVAIQSNVIVTNRVFWSCINFLSLKSTELCMCIKFCTELDSVRTQTYEMIKTAFQEDAMTCTRIFYWFCCFKNECSKWQTFWSSSIKQKWRSVSRNSWFGERRSKTNC